MNSYVNLHMNSYVSAFLDMNTQKFTLRRLNFVLRLPTKRSQVTKCSRPMTKFCLTNPYKRTPNSQNFRLRRLDFTFKSLQKNTQITKFPVLPSPYSSMILLLKIYY